MFYQCFLTLKWEPQVKEKIANLTITVIYVSIDIMGHLKIKILRKKKTLVSRVKSMPDSVVVLP